LRGGGGRERGGRAFCARMITKGIKKVDKSYFFLLATDEGATIRPANLYDRYESSTTMMKGGGVIKSPPTPSPMMY